MPQTLKLTALALLSSTLLTTPALAQSLSASERAVLEDRAFAALRDLGYQRQDFDRVRIIVGDDDIDVEAYGRNLDLDLTFARAGSGLGALIEGEIDDGTRDEDLILTSAGWVDEDDYEDRYEYRDRYDDDDDEYDDDDDEDYDDRRDRDRSERDRDDDDDDDDYDGDDD